MSDSVSRTLPLLCLALTITTASTGFGATFTTPIPDLIGFEASSREGALLDVEFDFSMSFERIDEVWIEIEATMTPQEWDQCGSVGFPQPCEHMIQFTAFSTGLDIEPQVPGVIPANIVGFGSESSVNSSVFVNGGTWDFLLDGKGQLTVFAVSERWFFSTELIGSLVPPTGHVTDARIIVEGVPEPSKTVLYATALAVLGALRLRAFRK